MMITYRINGGRWQTRRFRSEAAMNRFAAKLDTLAIRRGLTVEAK
jgi:hypothetical protein